MISEALSIALQQKQAGQIQAAEQTCGQILAADHNNAAALHLLGVIALEFGRPDLAVQRISRAIQSNPSEPAFYANLGNAYQAQSQLDEAVACFRKALDLNPNEAVIHFNLGNALLVQGKLQESIESYARSVDLKPDLPHAPHNLR